jgi:hypothetical protein
MNDVIHAVKRALKPRHVAHVADKKAKAAVLARERGLHLRLFQLVAAEHDDSTRLRPLQKREDAMAPERTGSAGDKNAFPVEIRISHRKMLRHTNIALFFTQ